jgi:hypothetical protein
LNIKTEAVIGSKPKEEEKKEDEVTVLPALN